MSEESATPDLAERVRLVVDAASRRDLDTLMTFYASDAVLEFSDSGMGTYEGVDAVRALIEDWVSIYEPDIVFRPVSTFTDSQERRGLGAMRRWMEEWLDAWADDYTTQAESIRQYGDVVIVLLRFTGHSKASGVEVTGGVFEVCRFRDGKIASVEDFTDRAEALKAAGLEG